MKNYLKIIYFIKYGCSFKKKRRRSNDGRALWLSSIWIVTNGVQVDWRRQGSDFESTGNINTELDRAAAAL